MVVRDVPQFTEVEDYVVLHSTYASEYLNTDIASLLKKGYQPVGDHKMIEVNGSVHFSQAMIKYKV